MAARTVEIEMLSSVRRLRAGCVVAPSGAVQGGHIDFKITLYDEKIGVVARGEPPLACADPACLRPPEVAVARASWRLVRGYQLTFGMREHAVPLSWPDAGVNPGHQTHPTSVQPAHEVPPACSSYSAVTPAGHHRFTVGGGAFISCASTPVVEQTAMRLRTTVATVSSLTCRIRGRSHRSNARCHRLRPRCHAGCGG